MDRDQSKTTPVHHRSMDERLNAIADLLAQGLTLGGNRAAHRPVSGVGDADCPGPRADRTLSHRGNATGPAAVENARVHPGLYHPQLLPAHGQGNREGLRP